ncbi:type II toxin-antitoxin system VapC family toxin [Ruegeria sp. HKCCD8929]|uniref:type II toxin-antitoxin system VapC family toxin n=1 Tax=Ruegeria sp. HKCCD8929 TaxID=2683006 RepID=UPI001489CF05|nr:type II toxin-antitoxin system VapC family toxin [Ruegeria sp. HKCCD8929]
MSAVLLDTHAWVWSFADDARLSRPARTAIELANAVYVSPISFFEIGQKVRLGKWPEMEPYADGLGDILRNQGGVAAPFTPEICLHASLRDWSHRDPFDRLLASSAELAGLTLISKDSVFSEVKGLHLVW